MDPQFDDITSRLGDCVVGFIEIGSRARGEAVSLSDHDIRVIITTDAPYLISEDHAWSSPAVSTTRKLPWFELNRQQGVTFGITNLGYVAANVAQAYFPLSDHTALFQGVILRDRDALMRSFIDVYQARHFANVIPDYMAQTEWRVSRRLAKEMDESWLFDHLDAVKQTIPAIHTCCRVVNDMAQIASYKTRGRYLSGHEAIMKDVATAWPAWLDAICEMFSFKMDEQRRRDLFARAQMRDPQCYSQVLHIAETTRELWAQFARRIDA